MSQTPNPSTAIVPISTAQMLERTAPSAHEEEPTQSGSAESKRTRGKGKKHDFIGNRWMNVEQVYEYFGGNITLSEVRELMQSGTIKSWWKTGAKKTLFTSRKFVEQWADDIERCRDTRQTRDLGAEWIVPVAWVRETNIGKKSY